MRLDPEPGLGPVDQHYPFLLQYIRAGPGGLAPPSPTTIGSQGPGTIPAMLLALGLGPEAWHHLYPAYDQDPLPYYNT